MLRIWCSRGRNPGKRAIPVHWYSVTVRFHPHYVCTVLFFLNRYFQETYFMVVWKSFKINKMIFSSSMSCYENCQSSWELCRFQDLHSLHFLWLCCSLVKELLLRMPDPRLNTFYVQGRPSSTEALFFSYSWSYSSVGIYIHEGMMKQ